MFFSAKRTITALLPAASLLLTGALLTGCSGDSEAASDKSSPSANGPFDAAIEYAKCMRKNGVSDFPDPKQDGGGIRMDAGSVDTSTQEFKTAQEACRDKSPQGLGPGSGSGGGKALDSAKVAAWAECIRKNGIPKFPDPEVNGGNMTLNFDEAGISPQASEFQKAREACQDKWPGGGMMIQGGGGQ